MLHPHTARSRSCRHSNTQLQLYFFPGCYIFPSIFVLVISEGKRKQKLPRFTSSHTQETVRCSSVKIPFSTYIYSYSDGDKNSYAIMRRFYEIARVRGKVQTALKVFSPRLRYWTWEKSCCERVQGRCDEDCLGRMQRRESESARRSSSLRRLANCISASGVLSFPRRKECFRL